MSNLRKTAFRAVVMIIVGLPLFTVSADNAKTLPIIIEVNGATVTASGLTPGGSAAVVCAWRKTAGEFSESSQTSRDAHVSGDGRVTVEFGSAIPASALIAVIDVATGRLETLIGTKFRRIDLPAKRFKKGADGQVDEFALPHAEAMVVLVRRGEGVWIQRLSDGGYGDDDGSLDGRLRINPERMTPIAFSGAAPKKIRGRDVVLLVDTSARVFAATEVTP